MIFGVMDDRKVLRSDLGAKDDRKEIAFLEEELIHLSVKSSVVDPSEKPTLICSVWKRKNYNPDSLRAQVRSIFLYLEKHMGSKGPLTIGIVLEGGE